LTKPLPGQKECVSRSVIELATSAAQIQEPAEALEAIAELKTRIDELEELHVEDALRRGFTWSAIAQSLQVSRQAVHKKYARRFANGRPASQTSKKRGMLITAEARRCVLLARRAAAALGHEEVGTGHLLLGLLREEGTAAHEALTSLGVAHSAALEVVRMRRRNPVEGKRKRRIPAEELPISQAGRRVFEHALREAVRLKSTHLCSQHLLLGALREQGVAVLVLEGLGVSSDALEERLMEVLEARNGD
jgi:Clp amino terminal domain, pathogenicity island component